MKCDCCGKKKRWREAYEDIVFEDNKLHVCVNCSTSLYKLRYEANNGDERTYKEALDNFKKGMSNPSDGFIKWFDNNKSFHKQQNNS